MKTVLERIDGVLKKYDLTNVQNTKSIARLIVEEMRAPTDTMWKVGEKYSGLDVWDAMIDEILRERPVTHD
jgi:hypothetical protein